MLGSLILFWIGGWLPGYVCVPCMYGPVVVHKTVGVLVSVCVCVVVRTCLCELAMQFGFAWGHVGLCAGRWTSVDATMLTRACICPCPVKSPVSLPCLLASDTVPSLLPLVSLISLLPDPLAPSSPSCPPATPLLLCNRDPECCWHRTPWEGVGVGPGACAGA